MANESTFTNEETGEQFRAVLIPAKVQFFRTEAGEGKAEHAVGTVEADRVLADPQIPSRELFGDEILFSGAAPWARKTAREMLG